MSAEEQQSSSPVDVDAKLIYVVDDESMVGDVVQIVLKRGGYNPKFFQDPQEALQVFIRADVKPVLLLTDFMMSPMNGMELIELCKPHHPQLRTILYSGNAGAEILQHYSFRPDAFLRKPFLPRDLLELVQTTLNAPAVVALAALCLSFWAA